MILVWGFWLIIVLTIDSNNNNTARPWGLAELATSVRASQDEDANDDDDDDDFDIFLNPIRKPYDCMVICSIGPGDLRLLETLQETLMSVRMVKSIWYVEAPCSGCMFWSTPKQHNVPWYLRYSGLGQTSGSVCKNITITIVSNMNRSITNDKNNLVLKQNNGIILGWWLWWMTIICTAHHRVIIMV